MKKIIVVLLIVILNQYIPLYANKSFDVMTDEIRSYFEFSSDMPLHQKSVEDELREMLGDALGIDEILLFVAKRSKDKDAPKPIVLFEVSERYLTVKFEKESNLSCDSLGLAFHFNEAGKLTKAMPVGTSLVK